MQKDQLSLRKLDRSTLLGYIGDRIRLARHNNSSRKFQESMDIMVEVQKAMDIFFQHQESQELEGPDALGSPLITGSAGNAIWKDEIAATSVMAVENNMCLMKIAGKLGIDKEACKAPMPSCIDKKALGAVLYVSAKKLWNEQSQSTTDKCEHFKERMKTCEEQKHGGETPASSSARPLLHFSDDEEEDSIWKSVRGSPSTTERKCPYADDDEDYGDEIGDPHGAARYHMK
eukprot:g1668.t1